MIIIQDGWPSQKHRRRRARGETRFPAAPCVCKPLCRPPGLPEGRGGKEVGDAQPWGSRERQSRRRAGARGSRVSAASCPGRWMSWGCRRSHRVKYCPVLPLSCISCIPAVLVQTAAGPLPRLFLREGVLTAEAQKEKFFISKTWSLQVIRKSTTCVRL